MIVVSVDTQKVLVSFDRMPANLRTAIRGATVTMTKQLAARVRENLSGRVLQRRSGDLYNSIRVELVENPDKVYGRVYVDPTSPAAKYAAAHEFGVVTKPHVILPRNASVLSFMWNGKRVFFKKVNHPGSKIPERSYMRSALEAMRDQIVAKYSAIAAEALKSQAVA